MTLAEIKKGSNMPAYLDLDDLEDKAIHLTDLTMMIAYDLGATRPDLVQELRQVTSKILAVAREQYKE
jgi:hypothetical protein